MVHHHFAPRDCGRIGLENFAKHENKQIQEDNVLYVLCMIVEWVYPCLTMESSHFISSPFLVPKFMVLNKNNEVVNPQANWENSILDFFF